MFPISKVIMPLVPLFLLVLISLLFSYLLLFKKKIILFYNLLSDFLSLSYVLLPHAIILLYYISSTYWSIQLQTIIYFLYFLSPFIFTIPQSLLLFITLVHAPYAPLLYHICYLLSHMDNTSCYIFLYMLLFFYFIYTTHSYCSTTSHNSPSSFRWLDALYNYHDEYSHYYSYSTPLCLLISYFHALSSLPFLSMLLICYRLIRILHTVQLLQHCMLLWCSIPIGIIAIVLHAVLSLQHDVIFTALPIPCPYK
jgi:hypothetical protein